MPEIFIIFADSKSCIMDQASYLSPWCEVIDLGLRERVMTTASNEDYTVTPQDPFGAPVFGNDVMDVIL